jgi:hypothetical protein
MQDGYFVEPTSDKFHWFSPQSNGATLLALKDVPCLVLLGDMGMGKSTVIAAEAELLSKNLRGQKHEVVLCDLKRLTEQQIYRQVFSDPRVQGWIDGKHTLTLFLDSLDECWRRIEELESILVGELQRCLQKKPPSLFLRLTCRSAEWRGNVGQVLKRLFPAVEGQENTVHIFTLAPLSKNNIQQAAQVKGCDGSDPAQLVDILVQAVPFGEDGKPGKSFTVVVEVKCAWNNGVLEDMEKQLYGRYLANSEYDFGIYVVAYFTCNAWNRPNDARKISGASTMKIDELKTKLCAQAKTLSSSEKRVEVLVINACIAEN